MGITQAFGNHPDLCPCKANLEFINESRFGKVGRVVSGSDPTLLPVLTGWGEIPSLKLCPLSDPGHITAKATSGYCFENNPEKRQY